VVKIFTLSGKKRDPVYSCEPIVGIFENFFNFIGILDCRIIHLVNSQVLSLDGIKI